MPRVFGVVGWKDSGKTTMVVKLVSALSARGLRVSTIKHAHVRFDIDHEGKDSHRHRQAGAAEVAIVSPVRWALMGELRGDAPPSLATMIGRMGPCDIVLVEGYKTGPHPKLEVRRALARQQTALPDDPTVVGLASDTPPEDPACPWFALDDIDALADFVILNAAEIEAVFTAPPAAT